VAIASEATGAPSAMGPEPARAAARRRADALDALRGFAILTMVLSGVVPYHPHALPSWMYHAQVPPPAATAPAETAHTFNPDVPGITWVDLVFPFFLFALGAALPLALGRRLEQGARVRSLIAWGFKRGGLLLAFAIYVQHLRLVLYGNWTAPDPNWPANAKYYTALVGFGLLFPVLLRLPRAIPGAVAALLRIVGWAAVIGWVVYVHYWSAVQGWWQAGPTFSAETWTTVRDALLFVAARSDIIIVVLAHCAAFGALIWLLTRRDPALRLGFVALVLGVILGAGPEGWVRDLWHTALVPGLLQLGFLKYLLIVLPGTIAGDLLRQWIDGRPAPGMIDAGERAPSGASPWSVERYFSLMGLTLLLSVFIVGGLFARYIPTTPLVGLLIALLGFAAVRGPTNPLEHLLAKLYGWGTLWLAAGLVLEAYEGGIRKDHATLSYYFTTSGLAAYALIFFASIADGLGRKWPIGLLTANGQNPMIAYVGIVGLIVPVLALTGATEWWIGYAADNELGPWARFGWSVGQTLALAIAVAIFSRLRLYWRT
jgi:predicted acyltransferase